MRHSLRRLDSQHCFATTRLMMLAFLIAALSTATCDAFDDPAVAQPNNATQPNASRLISSQLVQFELVLGRIQLSPEYFRIGSAHERIDLEGGRERNRSISVSVMRGAPTLQYQDRGGEESIQLVFKARHAAEIHWSRPTSEGRTVVTYRQPPEGSVTLEVQCDTRPKLCIEAASLWHVAMKDRDTFAKHFQPLLVRLEPSWDFDSKLKEIDALTRQTLERADPSHTKSLIEQLDAPKLAARSEAEQQLLALGLVAESQLQHARTTELSNQQRAAVDRILNNLRPTGNDSSMRVAIWISGDSANIR